MDIESGSKMNVCFYSAASEKRPVRLCEATRLFALESLNRKYGLLTREVPAVELGPEAAGLSPLELYDLAVREIALRAPLRICPGELVSGAATLGRAIDHVVPATLEGKPVQVSMSHLTVDFETVLRKGVNYLDQLIDRSEKEHKDSAFLASCRNVTASMRLWRRRYLEALRDMPGYEETYQNLCRVPFEPARTFHEAVQSLWFTFAFIRLCGNWPGIGRLDMLLGPYLEKDLEDGRLTLDEAREILAHFFIKGCEWITGSSNGSGDAQHYQNIVLGGILPDGTAAENRVTELVLDILEEMNISDFPTSYRVNRKTPSGILKRLARIIRHGGGTLAVYNEESVIETMTRYGYPLREARAFANDGCWEMQVPGKTFFSYIPFDALEILQKETLKSYAEPFPGSFEDLKQAFFRDIANRVGDICRSHVGACPDGKWLERIPCTVVSVFERGCIEKALSYMEGGPVYNVISPHLGGLADAADSLYAIKKLVYDEKAMSMDELFEALRADWEGYEPQRARALGLQYYGNANPEADQVVKEILEAFADACAAWEGSCGYSFPPGISTFGRQLEWAPNRLACPHGAKKGAVLAGNSSPTPGTDREGATSLIKSYCFSDVSRMVTGAALDVRFDPVTIKGDDGLSAVAGLIRAFVLLGGCFMQPDIADREILKRAMEHPEEYPTLSVRVSGWNARFVTLNRNWQEMVIDSR
ncbi:MAG: hypothetical protein ILO36_09160 [Abditibacteriota bacterium]|nr:hypothetical protein [Abditibacteriota bacterium]